LSAAYLGVRHGGARHGEVDQRLGRAIAAARIEKIFTPPPAIGDELLLPTLPAHGEAATFGCARSRR